MTGICDLSKKDCCYRILLVTDRSFVKSYDGSSAIYRSWLNNLRMLGHHVSVLSFNQVRLKWSPSSIDYLRKHANEFLIVDILPNMVLALIHHLLVFIWKLLSGRRYVPAWLVRFFRSSTNWNQIPPFLERGNFDVIIVNKVHTIFFVGADNLAAIPGIKLLDMHDNQVRRSILTRQVFLRLLTRFPIEICKFVSIHEVAETLCWSKESRMMREQMNIFSYYDRILFSSEEEATVFYNLGLSKDHGVIMPWPYENLVNEEKDKTESRPYDIGFIASSGLFNFEGLLFLAEQILPQVRAFKPDLRVLIAGSICSQARRIFENEANVTLIPWVEEIQDFYNSVEVVVVPLLSGTGVSIKTLEAAWMSSAIVSTSTGMRGLRLVRERDYFLADDGDAFSGILKRLLDDSNLRKSLRHNAAVEIRKRHSLSAFSAVIEPLFAGRTAPQDLLSRKNDENPEV